MLFCLGFLNSLLYVGVSNASRLFWLHFSSRALSAQQRPSFFPFQYLALAYTGLEVHSLLCQRPLHCDEGCTVEVACWLAQITHRGVTPLFVLNCCKCTYAQLLSAIQQGGCIQHLYLTCPHAFESLWGCWEDLVLVLCIFQHRDWLTQELEGTKNWKISYCQRNKGKQAVA